MFEFNDMTLHNEMTLYCNELSTKFVIYPSKYQQVFPK